MPGSLRDPAPGVRDQLQRVRAGSADGPASAAPGTAASAAGEHDTPDRRALTADGEPAAGTAGPGGAHGPAGGTAAAAPAPPTARDD